MRTYMPTKGEVERHWWIIDADDRVVGRLASRVARVLMGKHQATYTPHIDTGDHVVIINAEKVRFTGRKPEQQTYYSYSGYPGGLKERKFQDVIAKKPEDVITLAIRRMLPKTRMGRQMIRKLKVYAGPTHPHTAQQPQPLELS